MESMMDKTYLAELKADLIRAELRFDAANRAVDAHKEAGLPLEAERKAAQSIRDNLRNEIIRQIESAS